MAAKTLLSLGCCSVEPSTAKKQCVCYPTVGLMDGTVFREVLIALKEEATAAADAAAEEAVRDPSTSSPDWSGYGSLVEYMMRLRVFGGEGAGSNVPWVDQNAPYGSEFNWDTTGQEEVGVWGAFYNASNASLGELSLRAVNSILAYMPSTPNFGYHGSAAGWGDFSNNGKWMIEGGWEREGGHYRAGLNSIPVIERYRSHPDEYYLLEVAMGGITGVLGNIDATGAPSMAFHLYPFILAYDPRSGDHGLGFFGHALNGGAYVVRHPRLGTLCYLCDIVESAAGPAASALSAQDTSEHATTTAAASVATVALATAAFALAATTVATTTVDAPAAARPVRHLGLRRMCRPAVLLRCAVPCNEHRPL